MLTCQSAPTEMMSVNGGILTAVSAKLMTRANAKGMRKKTSRNSSGGRMMSHLPWRLSHSPVRGPRSASIMRATPA